MRAVTFNIQHGAEGLDRVSSFLGALVPDIVFLQEVDQGCARSGGVRQAETVAAGLGLEVAFGEAFRFDGGQYGIALLSRLPLKDIAIFPLPHPSPRQSDGNGEPRILLRARSGPWTLANTHLGLTPEERLGQAREIRGALGDARGLILAGDINEGPGGPVVQTWSGWVRDAFVEAGGHEERTAPPEGPPTRIDAILCGTGAPRALRAQLGPPGFSDHRAVIVDFEA